jgi:molybdopterin synthase catalytic subunit
LSARILVRVQKEIFDAAAEAANLTDGRTDIGALVTFMGLCRDEGGALAALEIEHYPGMAEEEIRRVAREAAARWPLEGIAAIHRFGLIRPGESIVLVVTASAHRAEAFAAASFLMDYLKTEAPFWKKKHLVSGTGDWVAAKAEDEAAAQKWRSSSGSRSSERDSAA